MSGRRPHANPGARRRFLRQTALASGTAALGFPALVRAQGPVAMRWQSSWSPKSPFHEYAADLARRVNAMAGGDLRVQLEPVSASAAVPPARLLDAVAKGALDAAHGVLNNHFERHPAFGLWGNGPAFGMDANLLLAWHRHGGGAELLKKLYKAVGADVVSLLYGPMPTQPLGWFKKRIARSTDLDGLRFRAAGLSKEIFEGLGAEVNPLPREAIADALARGVLDGAELNNATSDRVHGLPNAASVYMLQSYHQPAAQFEILFNKAKFDALPPRLRAVLENAVDAASAAMSWKAADLYSRDHAALLGEAKVHMHRTPNSVLQRQLRSFDAAVQKRREDPLFQEVLQSQREFASRAVKWQLDTRVSPALAYGHYFGPKPPAKRRR